jgi:plastocyanin
MGSDPVCEQKGQGATFEDLVTSGGKLSNVFVYVKSGLPQNSFAIPSAEAVLDQNGCRYVPHVLGVQANQPVKILNSDNTSHNVHPVPQKNREWNENQYPSAPPIVKRFSEPEVLIPVKCNQHSWMKAYIGVLPHPFFAVTGPDGSFTLKGLPPGEYEIEAWHEKLGPKVTKVSVKQKGEAEASFEFDAASVANQGLLRMKPALVLP